MCSKSSSVIGLVAVICVLAMFSLLAPSAGASTLIYYTKADGTVHVRNATTGAVVSSSLVTVQSGGGQFGANGVAVDSLHGYVYWTGQRTGPSGTNNTGFVRRASAIDGASASDMWTTSGTGGSANWGISVSIDASSNTAYWTSVDGSVSSVHHGDATGSSFSSSISSIDTLSGDIVAVFDKSSSNVYFASSSAGGTPIFSTYPASTLAGATLFATVGQTSLTSIATSLDGTTIYWNSCGSMDFSSIGTSATCSGPIKTKATSSGTANVTNLTSNLPGLTALALDSLGCIYYASANGAIVQHATTPDCTHGAVGSDGGGVITALAIVDAPRAVAPARVSGSASIGATLTCGDATWADDVPGAHLSRLPTAARTYQWYLDGTAITGQTVATYTAASPGAITCAVTASNVAGSGSSTSSALTIASPTSPTAVATTTAAATPATTTKTYPKIKITWTLKVSKLKGTFKPVTGAKTYSLVGTGATRKTGTCKTSGSGKRAKVTCTLTLKKGATTVTVNAKSKTKAILAQTVTSKKAK